MNRNPANRALPVGLVVLLAGATMTATPVLALSEFQGAPAPIAGEQNAAPGDEAEEAAPEERTPPLKFQCPTLSSTGRPSS